VICNGICNPSAVGVMSTALRPDVAIRVDCSDIASMQRE
jgi:hypothetical protein